MSGLNKLVLDQDGLIVGNRQIDASQNGVYFSGNGMFGSDLVVTGNVVVGGTISSPSTSNTSYTGSVVQTKYLRVDERISYSSSATLVGTPVNILNMTITPRFATSMILCQWMISGEFHHDNVFLIFKNGVIADDGYNLQSGNVQYSGYAVSAYDVDNASTPFNMKIMYAGFPNSVGPVTYGLAIRSSSSTAGTILYLNRPVSGLGSSANENGVSIGIIQEITQ